jgi:hypothetical protein
VRSNKGFYGEWVPYFSPREIFGEAIVMLKYAPEAEVVVWLYQIEEDK